VILNKNIERKMGIASLTKLMTCLVVIDLIEKLKLDIENLILIPSK
jgi:D-alanyl-D-alanine carboxypeptidase